MKIIHTVHFSSDDNVEQILDIHSVKFKRTPFFDKYRISLQIAESDDRWPVVQELIISTGRSIGTGQTVFTKKEILNAKMLRMFGQPNIGYPQPEERWLAESPNYEDWCQECGTFRQVSSFFIDKEPKIHKYDFMSLHWTSAVFTVQRVFDSLHTQGTRGYERWPVYLHRTMEPSETISQLYVPALDEPALVDADNLEPITCPSCGELKYQKHHKRGAMYLRKEAIPREEDIFETYEWFGGGHQPRREVIVSNRVAKLAYDEGWRGVAFKVVELV